MESVLATEGSSSVLKITDVTNIHKLTIPDKYIRKTTNFAGKWHFLGIWKGLNLGLKIEKQLQNKNHIEDWALGSNPRDTGHRS